MRMNLWRVFRKKRSIRTHDITPEEIFLDSSNLPAHDIHAHEAHVERPVSPYAIIFIGVFFAGVTGIFGARAFNLQIMHGEAFASVSRENTLKHSPTS